MEIDYLTGDDAYKSAWMSHRRERIGVLACNLRSARGLLAAAREKAASLSAPWRRRLRERELGLRCLRPPGDADAGDARWSSGGAAPRRRPPPRVTRSLSSSQRRPTTRITITL